MMTSNEYLAVSLMHYKISILKGILNYPVHLPVQIPVHLFILIHLDCGTIRKWLTKCEDDSETANYITANTKDVSRMYSHATVTFMINDIKIETMQFAVATK